MFDVERRELNLELPDDEIAERVAAYEGPAAAYTNGVLGKYRKLVGSAAGGRGHRLVARVLAVMAMLALPCRFGRARPASGPARRSGEGHECLRRHRREAGQPLPRLRLGRTPQRATLSVWFRGDIAGDGSLSATDHGVTLAARIANDRARGTVTLPDGRVLRFAMRERRGGLVERNFIHEGVRYRSGWIVLEDNRVRGRTMVARGRAHRRRPVRGGRTSTCFAPQRGRLSQAVRHTGSSG